MVCVVLVYSVLGLDCQSMALMDKHKVKRQRLDRICEGKRKGLIVVLHYIVCPLSHTHTHTHTHTHIHSQSDTHATYHGGEGGGGGRSKVVTLQNIWVGREFY